MKVPILTDWNISTPTLFRYLPKQFVDQFFSNGYLRLSSFSQFHNHTDEQRLDKQEGKTLFVHRTYQGGGQTFEALTEHGHDAYILSTSVRYGEDLLNKFGDSYIRINHSTNFGVAISRQIPGLIAGFEGLCLYQNNKIIEKDLGYINLDMFKDSKHQNFNKSKLDGCINQQMKHYPMFLKDKIFVNECEYRFVWFTNNKISDYIDIEIPDAIQFCTPPNKLTE